MDINIIEVLQSRAIASTVEEMIKFGQNGNSEGLNLVVLQFLINILDRSFVLNVEELETLKDDEQCQEFLLEIYEKDEYEVEGVTYEVGKVFLRDFIYEAFVCRLLDDAHILSWINFLKGIAEHAEIPDDSSFKGRAFQIMAFFLNPFANLAQIIDSGDDELNVSEELTAAITFALNEITKCLPKGLEFEPLAVSIATEFVEAMETYWSILIRGERNCLKIYRNLLQHDSNLLHSTALKSLKSLCKIENISMEMKAFLFEDQQETSEGFLSFMCILDELMTRKSLKLAVIALFRAMSRLVGTTDFVSEEMRRELYMNILTGNKKIVFETVRLMQDFDDDFWPEIIKLVNFYAGDDFQLSRFIEAILSAENVDCDVNTLVKVTTDNLHIPATSQRAAQILIALLKEDESEHESFLQACQIILQHCLEEEKTFIILLDFFHIIDNKYIVKFYKESPSKLHTTVELMLTAFKSFSTPLLLYNVCAVLKDLFMMQPEYTTKEIRKVFELLYSEFKNIFARTDNMLPLSHDYKTCVQKMTILLEYRKFNIIQPPHRLVQLDKMLKLLCRDVNDDLYPLFAKFRANFLKHMCTRLVLNMPVLNDTQQLAEDIKEFSDDIIAVIASNGFDLGKNHELFNAFLDVLVMFQPAMAGHINHDLFTKAVIVIDKTLMKKLCVLIEDFVFANESRLDDPEVYFNSETILLSWNNFIQNYVRPPSLTASSIIITHYRLNHPLKDHLEDLLKLLKLKSIAFAQNIAFATLTIMNSNSFEAFRDFYQAFEDFMSKNFEDQTARLVMLTSICSSILTKIPAHIQINRMNSNVNRLEVLECIRLIGRNFPSEIKKELQRLHPINFNAAALTETENLQMQKFHEFLRS